MSQENNAKGITLHLSACLLPIVHLDAISFSGKQHTCNFHLHDVKENVIHKTKPSSSNAPWSSSDAHVLIIAVFGSGQCGYCVLTPFF